MKAIWKDTVIAESNNTELVEGNHYFPAESVKMDFLKESTTHSICPWKGKAHYYHLIIDGDQNQDAVWVYPKTKPLAKNIEGYFAFWNGVEVIE